MLDDCETVEDEMPGIRFLAQLAIDPGAQRERMGIGDFISRDDPGARRSVCVEGLSDRLVGVRSCQSRTVASLTTVYPAITLRASSRETWRQRRPITNPSSPS